jgi:hypothetical protein
VSLYLRQQCTQQTLCQIITARKSRSNLETSLGRSDHAIGDQLAGFDQPECMAARLMHPGLQEHGARNAEIVSIELIDLRERDGLKIDGPSILKTACSAFKAQIAPGQLKAALGVERHHVEHAVHTDGRTWLKAGQQAIAPVVPQLRTQALATQISANDEQPHESELSAIGQDGAPRYKLITAAHGDKRVRIKRPGEVDVSSAWVPTLRTSPLGQGLNFILAHLIDADIQRVVSNLFRHTAPFLD